MDDHPITNRSPLSPLFVCGGILLLVGDVSAEAEDSSPLSTEAEEVRVNEEFELLNEEEILSIATRYERPIPQAPSKVYFIIDEDIRHSGATVIPTVLRRVPDLSVMQVTGTDFHVSAGRDNQLSANKILMMVDGRSVHTDGQGVALWTSLPRTAGRAGYRLWERGTSAGYMRDSKLPPRHSPSSMANARSIRWVTSSAGG
jgi:hypothetical protein